MSTKIVNTDNSAVSLQVSKMGNVESGNTMFDHYCVLKNITDQDITVTLVLTDGTEISTVLYSGWNPEIVAGVKNALANTLQYGY